MRFPWPARQRGVPPVDRPLPAARPTPIPISRRTRSVLLAAAAVALVLLLRQAPRPRHPDGGRRGARAPAFLSGAGPVPVVPQKVAILVSLLGLAGLPGARRRGGGAGARRAAERAGRGAPRHRPADRPAPAVAAGAARRARAPAGDAGGVRHQPGAPAPGVHPGAGRAHPGRPRRRGEQRVRNGGHGLRDDLHRRVPGGGRATLQARFLRAAPRRYRRDARELWNAFGFTLSRYLGGLGLSLAIQGVFSALALGLLGVPYPILLGAWVSVTALLPYVGAWIGAVPAVLLALSVSPTTALLTAGLFLVIQQLEGNVLTPRIQSQAVRVHPILVFLAVIAGASWRGSPASSSPCRRSPWCACCGTSSGPASGRRTAGGARPRGGAAGHHHLARPGCFPAGRAFLTRRADGGDRGGAGIGGARGGAVPRERRRGGGGAGHRPDVAGSSEAEARRAAGRHGPNELAAEPPVPRWRRFLAQFQDALVVLLLVATAISAGLWVYERDAALPYEALAIFAVVLLNAAMGYVQEARAEQAVAALRAMSAADAQRGPRRRAAAHPGRRGGPGRRHPGRGGRHHAGRRAAGRVDRAADGGGGAHRREPARLQGHRARGRGGGAGRPAQHGLQRHGGDLRARHGRSSTATGMRTEMGRIAGLLRSDRATRRPRCSGSSTARASCWASSSSSSPSS